MKKFVFALLLAVSLGMQAQKVQDDQQRFNPEQFRTRMEAYITRVAQLTPDEAQKFFPLLDELKSKSREISEKAFNNRPKDKAALTDKDYLQMIASHDQAEEQCAELKTTYHKKMLKVLPAEKVFKAIMAENTFHRNMLREMGGRQQNGQGRPQNKGLRQGQRQNQGQPQGSYRNQRSGQQ